MYTLDSSRLFQSDSERLRLTKPEKGLKTLETLESFQIFVRLSMPVADH